MKTKFKNITFPGAVFLILIVLLLVAATTPIINGVLNGDMNANFFSFLNPKSYWSREVNVRAFGAKGDGVTDDTVSIQAAIDSLTNNGVGGVVVFPDGLYRINGAFTESSGAIAGLTHSQLHLPVRSLNNQTICPITLRGVTDPTLNTIWNNSALPAVNTNGAILISTNIPADPSYTIIGGAAPTGSTLNQTAVYLKLERLTFRVYDNPQTTPLNLANVGQAVIRDCVVDTGQPGGQQSQPTFASVGIITPTINNWVISEIHNVDVRGFNVGYQLNEHSDVDDARVWMCNRGWYFPGGTHGIHMGHTVTSGCTLGVVGGPTGGFIQRLDWGMYAVEHSILPAGGAWANTVADFWDTNSVIRGIVNFASVDSGVGGGNTFTVNGTTNVSFFNANNASYSRINLQAMRTNNADNGSMLVAKNGDGVNVGSMGTFGRPFQNFGILSLGPGSFNNEWQIATNFALASNGTNNTTLNVGQPEGSDASGSRINFQVGHQDKMILSNSVLNVGVPMAHGFIGNSNYISGQFYTNLYSGPINVKGVLDLVTGTTAGSAACQMWIQGVITNSAAITATSIAQPGLFMQLEGDVPPGAFFVFTNTSIGAGNSITLFRSQVKGD